MNHCFLIIAHNNPLLLKRIVYKLQDNNHFFFIHIDKKVNIKPFIECLYGLKNIIFIENRIKVNWGGFSEIQCELLLLRTAFSAPIKMDYFHLVSGADYPCRNNKDFNEYFIKHNGESFMHYDSNIEIQMWRETKYRDRIQKWNFIDIFPFTNKGFSLKLRRCVQRAFNIFVKREWIPNVVAGWQWFSWHRSVVEYVLKYIKLNPDYLNRYKYTSYCDEVIFHTLLQNKTNELKINKYNSLRYIEWHPKRVYKSLPLVLKETEYEDIIKSNSMFCRKVDTKESHVLLSLLDDVLK